jgi:hypothetical protein
MDLTLFSPNAPSIPVEIDYSPAHGGHRFVATFPNGYGASIIQHEYSYGGREGLWEIAVLGKNGQLDYTTPVTDDVLGYVPQNEVMGYLEQIAAL